MQTIEKVGKLFVESGATYRLVQGADVILDSSLAVPGKHMIVRADTLTIRGGITMPGQTIEILAREVTCENNALIDVSGAPHTEVRIAAADGTNPGDAGAGGKTGQVGMNAGSIRIVAGTIAGTLELRANGGPGEQGQDGGHGAQGGVGENGRDAEVKKGGYDANPGGKGHTGGTAGRGGDGGRGGDAGRIEVLTRVALKHGVLKVSAIPGVGGAGGAPGQPGGGGPPGSGGRKVACSYEPSEHEGPHGRF